MKTKLVAKSPFSESENNPLTDLHLGIIGLPQLDPIRFEAWCFGYEVGRESLRETLTEAQRQAQAAIDAARYALHFRGVGDRYAKNVFRAYRVSEGD